MNRLLITAATLCLLPFTSCVATSSKEPDPMNNPSEPTYLRGVNISHYISQLIDNRYANPERFNEEDMAWIAKQGYDHIRLPIDGPYLASEDGEINWDRLKPVDDVLAWAEIHQIAVILDMHKLPGSNFDSNPDNRLFTDPALQNLAVNLWTGIAKRYKHVGDRLQFELLNEPVAPDPKTVTQTYALLIEAIRKISPERKILVCSNRWGSFDTVKHLEPLLSDKHVIVAVHYYKPHIFTHQKASWTGNNHPDFPDIPFPGIVPDLGPYVAENHYGNRYSGAELTVASIRKDFAKLKSWAEEQDVEVHVGEFGAYGKAKAGFRRNWYNAVIEEAEKNGIGWAVWDYKGGFAVRDKDTGKPTLVQEVIHPYLNAQ